MKTEILISASIVTYNDVSKAVAACRSILDNTKGYPLKLYVIDNASTDDTVKRIEEIEGVEVIKNNDNIGFGAAHNKMLGLPMGKYHFVINPDIVIKSDVLSDFADYFEQNPDVVMAMPKICNPDGSEQKLPKEMPTAKRLFLGRLASFSPRFAAVRNEYIWADREITEPVDVNFCTGCFFCIRSEVFSALQGFDDRYFMYLEDVDLTVRAKEYGRVVMNPEISVIHEWGRDSAKKLKYLFIHICSSVKFLYKWRKK